MAGAGIKITTDDAEFERGISELVERVTNLTPIHRILGEVAAASIDRNFEEGGRPKWAPHSPVTIALTGEHGILTLTGRMRRSINVQADDQSARVGTNAIYAAVQQFGALKGSFKSSPRLVPWGDIPARPFIAIQAEDKTEMVEEVREYLGKGSQ